VSKEIVGRRIRIDRDQRVGFIAVDNGNDDVFVHRSALAPGGFDTRKEGQELEFEVVSRQGWALAAAVPDAAAPYAAPASVGRGGVSSGMMMLFVMTLDRDSALK
jgi:cold shock CspA family protein